MQQQTLLFVEDINSKLKERRIKAKVTAAKKLKRPKPYKVPDVLPVVTKILEKFKVAHPNTEYGACNWFIGEEGISNTLRKSIIARKNRLYEIPVSFVPGGTGAIILPPNPDEKLKQRKVI